MLAVENLHVEYRARGGIVRAVAGVDLAIARGETLGLVGESGCGKSSLARAVMRLQPATRGTITIDGVDVTALRGRALRRHRHLAQMVFQDSAAALDPRFTLARIIEEPLRVTEPDAATRTKTVARLMDQVGLATSLGGRYPHELSGGQRQRAAIARALAPRPKLLVLDEPVSALDISLQAQVLNLLVELQREHGLAYLFVSHDIGVVQHMADRVAVMYLGRVVETGSHADTFATPAHPYTAALMRAVPQIAPRTQRIARKEILAGELPSPLAPPTGCTFHPRCPLARARCAVDAPALEPASAARAVACHFADVRPASTRPLNDRVPA